MLREPETHATDAELAAYYDEHRDEADWEEPRPTTRGRLDVTISVRFTKAEIASIRARARAAGEKPTSYIRRAVLAQGQLPVDRERVSRTVEALARDLEDLRQATS